MNSELGRGFSIEILQCFFDIIEACNNDIKYAFYCRKYCVTFLLSKRLGYTFNNSFYNVLWKFSYVNDLCYIFEHDVEFAR